MSNSSALSALEYAPESAFAESSTTFATLRINTLTPPSAAGLTWAKEAQGTTKQYAHDDGEYVLMTQGGSFDITLDLTGHGSTMVGSPTVTALETFLGYIWGNVSASLPASTTFTGGTTTAPTTTASATFPAGGLCRAGSLGDGRGNGQFYAVSTHATTTLNLLTGMAVAPNNGDILYPATNIYFHETLNFHGLTSSVPALRFRFLFQGLQYACHGCVPTAFSLLNLNPGGRPQIKITFAVSRWSAVTSGTYPSTVTTHTNLPGPVAGGSLFFNTVGTATRSTVAIRELSINVTLGMAILPGYGGVGAYQDKVDCVRLPSTVEWSWLVDADSSATATPTVQTLGTASGSTSYKHVLATLNTTDGQAVGFYTPNLHVSSVSVQDSTNGINTMRLTAMARSGPTKTNDLTASMLRMAWA